MAHRAPPPEPVGRATARARVLAAAVLCLAPLAAGAVDPGEVLADPALEARARELGKELRCLVCQNQSIDDSDAELARDLRRLVRERLKAGASDREVLDYVVSRYGDFVLLRPPVRADTVLLWAGPALLLAAGGGALAVFYRKRRTVSAGPSSVPLNAEEEAAAARLLADEKQ